MAPGDRVRIFQRFTRATPGSRGDGSGTGLGLALVDRHLRLMGGSVEVSESPHGGGRFTVRLPAAPR